GGGEPRVQRQHLEPLPPGQHVGGVADLPLTAEEDQYVARPGAGKLIDRVADRLRLVSALVDGPVPHLHRVRPPGHLNHRCSPDGSSWRRQPRMKSMFRLRSCASSMISVSYRRKRLSRASSVSRMPSVISLISVSSADLSVNRTL